MSYHKFFTTFDKSSPSFKTLKTLNLFSKRKSQTYEVLVNECSAGSALPHHGSQDTRHACGSCLDYVCGFEGRNRGGWIRTGNARSVAGGGRGVGPQNSGAVGAVNIDMAVSGNKGQHGRPGP